MKPKKNHPTKGKNMNVYFDGLLIGDVEPAHGVWFATPKGSLMSGSFLTQEQAEEALARRYIEEERGRIQALQDSALMLLL